jgi:hypothetical protein
METLSIEGYVPQINIVCSKDELRPAFTGVYIHNSAAIATDAHMLAMWKPKEKDLVRLLSLFEGKIIKAQVWQLLVKTKFVEFDPENSKFIKLIVRKNKNIDMQLYINLDDKANFIDEKYPDYWCVIDVSNKIEGPNESNLVVPFGLNIKFLSKINNVLSTDKTIDSSINSFWFSVKNPIKAVLIQPRYGFSFEEYLFLVMPTAISDYTINSNIYSTANPIHQHISNLKNQEKQ